MHVNFQKNNVSHIKSSFSLSDAQINLPTFSSLLGDKDCISGIAIQKVKLKRVFNIKLILNLKIIQRAY